jgi:zinc transport system substrate-binding protein
LKKVIVTVLTIMLLFISSGCTQMFQAEHTVSNRFTIVTTVFPAYDFAREIAGDCADVILLVHPGTEIHDYSPSPGDIKKIIGSDLLIYNGGDSDVWVEKLIDSSDTQISQLRMMDCVDLLSEEITEEMSSHEEGGQEPDEHVWTSPLNAIKICNAINERLQALDPANAEIYQKNTTAYIEKLKQLDAQFRTIVRNSQKKLLVFADRFPARYFTEEYSLSYAAVFPGCSEESEPSAKTVARIIEIVKEKEISCVLYIEMSDKKMAEVICEETGCESAEFNCCHNISREDFENGKTYLELMTKNLESVRKALS